MKIHIWAVRNHDSAALRTFKTVCGRSVPEGSDCVTLHNDAANSTCLDCLRSARREAMWKLVQHSKIVEETTPQIERIVRSKVRARERRNQQ